MRRPAFAASAAAASRQRVRCHIRRLVRVSTCSCSTCGSNHLCMPGGLIRPRDCTPHAMQGCPAPNQQRGEPAECFPLRSLLRRRHPCHGHGTFVKQHTFLILNPAYAFGFHPVSSAVPCVTLSCEVTIHAVVRRPGRPVDSPAPQFPKQTGAAPGASGSPRRPLNRRRGAMQPKPSAKNSRIRVTMLQLFFSLKTKE